MTAGAARRLPLAPELAVAENASARPPMPVSGLVLLSGEHLLIALLYLAAGAAGLVWIAPELARGEYASPHVAGVTHLFTLGWLTTTIFGALCQLLPSALGAPLRSTRAAHATLWLFAPGVGIFATGVAFGSTGLRHLGIALVSLGVLTAVANIGASLSRARTRGATWEAAVTAISFLLSTLVLGILLLHNLQTGFIAEARLRVLAVHLHVALVGWVLMMIVGFSHKLLPMFLVARNADTKWTRRSIRLLAAGVISLALGELLRAPVLWWTAVALLESGVGCFLFQARLFFRARMRRPLDPGTSFAAAALMFLATSALIGPLVLLAGTENTRFATAYVTMGLLGGLVLYVIGFFYKIGPHLAWIVRYRGRAGTGRVPIVAEMFSARAAYAQLGLMVLALLLLMAGVVSAAPGIARCGALLYLAGVLVFGSQIAGLALRGRRGLTR